MGVLTTIEGVDYYRTYACEVEPGDVTALGETVDDVIAIPSPRGSVERVIIRMTNGEQRTYRRDTIVLVRDW